MQVTMIGLDIAKNVFQVHAIDAAEKVVVRKQLRRSQVLEFFRALPACLVGMEACATAHYWARELTQLGHQVRLMPAKDVKAYVKRSKNDAADAEAICEAVRRPTMRFVQVKSAEQQGRLMLHRTRDLLMRQRTQLINALRAHLAELGILAKLTNSTCDLYIATINSFISAAVGGHPQGGLGHRTLEKRLQKIVFIFSECCRHGNFLPLDWSRQARINSAYAGALASAVYRLPLVA